MSLTIKHRKSLQGFDAAELERRANLARMTGVADRCDPDGPTLMLGRVILFCAAVLLALVFWALPDVIAWLFTPKSSIVVMVR